MVATGGLIVPVAGTEGEAGAAPGKSGGSNPWAKMHGANKMQRHNKAGNVILFMGHSFGPDNRQA